MDYNSNPEFREELLRMKSTLTQMHKEVSTLEKGHQALVDYFSNDKVEERLETILSILNGCYEDFVKWGYERPLVRWERNKDSYDVLSSFFLKEGAFDPRFFGNAFQNVVVVA